VSESDVSQADRQLVRAIGAPSLTANIINTTIGAGIFVLPALVAGKLGSASPIAFLVCAVVMALVVTSFAIAGSRVSLTGGLYAYVEVAFGRYIGFVAGVLFFFTAILSVSGVINVFVTTIGAAVPLFASPPGRFSLALLVLGVLAWINVRGVRAGARAVDVVTLVKAVPLLIFVAVGIFFIPRDAIALPPWPGAKPIGDGVLLLIFAFAGIEVALAPSGEVKHPARTVPRAIYAALILTTILYILIQLVAQGILDGELAKHPDAPLAEAATRFLGNAGRTLMLVGATLSAFGFITSDILSAPRIIFAFGRDGVLPAWFAHTHPRFYTPDVAIISYCVIVFVISLSSTFQQLAILANVAVLLLYVLCCAAALELMRRKVRSDGKPFHIPGAPIIPILAIAIIVWILAHATLKEFVVTGICLAVCSFLFLLRQAATRRA
jgi:basic amino acid/polyamine antiporter, APA family